MAVELKNSRITERKRLIPPAIMMDELPITPAAARTIRQARTMASDIIHGKDDRLMVLVGPCSIHDVKAAREYGDLLLTAKKQFQHELQIVMRVYFEKPRTTVGWKGLINDPDLDGSFQINKGLRLARELLLDLSSAGLPCGTEFLEVVSPQYVDDLVSWGAIGARTTESQLHRELASGLPCPIGFKNGTDGNVKIAIDAVGAARSPHHFLSIMEQGNSAIFTTAGNLDTHVILRGSKTGTNFERQHIAVIAKQLQAAGLATGVMVDCSHGNSDKDHLRQPLVAADVAAQVANGANDIMGVMLESHLKPGKQLMHRADLEYGKSVTDACMSWEATLPVLETLAMAVVSRRKAHSSCQNNTLRTKVV